RSPPRSRPPSRRSSAASTAPACFPARPTSRSARPGNTTTLVLRLESTSGLVVIQVNYANVHDGHLYTAQGRELTASQAARWLHPADVPTLPHDLPARGGVRIQPWILSGGDGCPPPPAHARRGPGARDSTVNAELIRSPPRRGVAQAVVRGCVGRGGRPG